MNWPRCRNCQVMVRWGVLCCDCIRAAVVTGVGVGVVEVVRLWLASR